MRKGGRLSGENGLFEEVRWLLKVRKRKVKVEVCAASPHGALLGSEV